MTTSDALHKDWAFRESTKLEPDDNQAMAKYLQDLQSGQYKARIANGQLWESFDYGKTWIKTD